LALEVLEAETGAAQGVDLDRACDANALGLPGQDAAGPALRVVLADREPPLRAAVLAGGGLRKALHRPLGHNCLRLRQDRPDGGRQRDCG